MNNYLDESMNQEAAGFILLAEDDDDDRFLMKEFFSINGYKNKIVTSGVAAVDFLQSLSPADYPSLILLDYSMPVLNGEEVLLFIKASDVLKQTPVIIYSSEMNDQLKARLEAHGALSCFSKASHVSEWNKMKKAIEALLFSGNFQFKE